LASYKKSQTRAGKAKTMIIAHKKNMRGTGFALKKVSGARNLIGRFLAHVEIRAGLFRDSTHLR